MQLPNAQGLAPARLDILGGIADYSGALVIQAPLDIYTRVSLYERSDHLISIQSGKQNTQFDLNKILSTRGAIVSSKQWLKYDPPKWSLYIFGCLFVLLDEYDFKAKGLDLVIESDVPIGSGLSSSAALEMASLRAMRTFFQVKIDDLQLAVIGQKAENKVVGVPCGIMDQIAVHMGRQGHVLPLICKPHHVLPHVKIPKEIIFCAINTGVKHNNAGLAYTNVRIATFMGLQIIQSHRKINYLTDITVEEFENDYLRLLPEVVNGTDFIRDYGSLVDQETSIDPKGKYFVRKAASFPIYENERSQQFLSLLKSAALDKQALGLLMLGSQKGYQNIGISCKEADYIVSLLAKIEGLYGARLTGGGSGGSVAVLAKNMAAVKKLRNAYYEKFGFRSKIEQTKYVHKE